MNDSVTFYDVGTFGAWDYVVVVAMLAISALVGIYYSMTGGKQKTSEEFFVADRSMSPIPVALSLVASFISANTILGAPSEVYFNGSMYGIYVFSFIGMVFIASLFMPTFYRLGLTSADEYLEMRFNRGARLIVTCVFIVHISLYIALCIYGPALALSQVTGLNLWGSIILSGAVCTFYTTIGGMKAVLWTDTFQISIMFGGLIAVIVSGSYGVGGFDEVWRLCEEGQRIDFWNFDPDPTIRHTFWTLAIGGSFFWASIYGTNQAQVQRFLSCGSVKTALVALSLAGVGIALITVCCTLTGLVIYANFRGCDPISKGYIETRDQILPYFTIYQFKDMPGMSGFVTSAVFSASLSSVSSSINALAAVTGEDIIKSIWPRINETLYTRINKVLALLYGLLGVGLTWVISLFSAGILVAAYSLFGMLGGPVMGIYALGMFFPWTNTPGAITGILCGLVWSLWVGIGAVIYRAPSARPPLRTDWCTDNITTTESSLYATGYMMSTMEAVAPDPRPEIAELYTLSYAWYACVGMLVTIFCGLIASFLTGANDPRKVNPKLITPLADRMYCCLPESWKRVLRCHVGEDYEDDTDKNAEKMTYVNSVYHVDTDKPGINNGSRSANGKQSVDTNVDMA